MRLLSGKEIKVLILLKDEKQMEVSLKIPGKNVRRASLFAQPIINLPVYEFRTMNGKQIRKSMLKTENKIEPAHDKLGNKTNLRRGSMMGVMTSSLIWNQSRNAQPETTYFLSKKKILGKILTEIGN